MALKWLFVKHLYNNCIYTKQRMLKKCQLICTEVHVKTWGFHRKHCRKTNKINSTPACRVGKIFDRNAKQIIKMKFRGKTGIVWESVCLHDLCRCVVMATCTSQHICKHFIEAKPDLNILKQHHVTMTKNYS